MRWPVHIFASSDKVKGQAIGTKSCSAHLLIWQMVGRLVKDVFTGNLGRRFSSSQSVGSERLSVMPCFTVMRVAP